MTQGYGPENGQQGQWGPQGQQQTPQPNPQQGQWGQDQAPAAPQWGQPEQQAPAAQPQWGQTSPSQPQWGQASPAQSPAAWGQASPAAAPGGYPGAAGAGTAASFGGPVPAKASKVATMIKAMFFAVLALVLVRLIGNIIVFAISFAGGASGSLAVAGASTAVSYLFLGLNMLVSLAVLVLAGIVIAQASGRGRTGAIIVIATIVLSVISYWILYGGLLLFLNSLADFSTIGVAFIIYQVIEIIRVLIVFAALIVGAMMSRRWAAKNA